MIADVTATSATSRTAFSKANGAKAGRGENAALLPSPEASGDDMDALTLMYTLTAQQGQSDSAAQRASVRSKGQERKDLLKKVETAQRKEASEAKKQEHHGGLFKGLKSVVSNVVNNVSHLRVAELVKDLKTDLGTCVDVKNPQFWKDIGSIAKLYGKGVAMACAMCATVLTGGAFAIAVCAAVCVAMAASAAMDDCKLGDAMNMSKNLQLGLSIGASVVAAVGTAGIGAVGTAAQTVQIAEKVNTINSVGRAIEGGGKLADGGAAIIQSNYVATLELLQADTMTAQSASAHAGQELQASVSDMAAIVRVYETSQSILIDSIGIQERGQRAVTEGGIRA